MVANSSVGPQQRIDFEYDWRSRRIAKQVWAIGGASPTNSVKFVYDGWNLLAVLNSQSSVLQWFTWGLDLSGTEQGAGGVGGLLQVSCQGGQLTNCFAAYDGNGNLTALADAANGSVLAQYEYGPFGEVLRATGPMARANPFRFSTKYQDDETDLLYYGYRYYNASTGRWLSYDPLAQRTSDLVYVFCNNSPIQLVDALGLESAHWEDPGITFRWNLAEPEQKKSHPDPKDPSWIILGETTGSLLIDAWRDHMKCGNGQEMVISRGVADVSYWWSDDQGKSSQPHEKHHVEIYKAAFRDAFDGISWITGSCMCPKRAKCWRDVAYKLGQVSSKRAEYENAKYDCDQYASPTRCKRKDEAMFEMERLKASLQAELQRCSEL